MDKQQAHQLLDRLDPAQFNAVAQLLEVLTTASEPLKTSLTRAEVEDEEITQETADQLSRARVAIPVQAEQDSGVKANTIPG